MLHRIQLNVAHYSSSVTGFHGFQSSLQCGDDVEESAWVGLENFATDAVRTFHHTQMQHYHGNHLLMK